MGLRENFRKAAGLFVQVSPEDTAPQELDNITLDSGDASVEPTPPVTKTIEELARETAGPALNEVTIAADTAPAVIAQDGTLDFTAIYQLASMPAAPFTAEQMLEMLNSLPADLPLDTKRQTVRATLGAMGKAIGATPETIVTDASRKLAALAAYVDHYSKQTAEFLSTAQLEIANLQAQIEEKRKEIDAAQSAQKQVASACDTESDHLDQVLEFFSLDVPPSKYAK